MSFKPSYVPRWAVFHDCSLTWVFQIFTICGPMHGSAIIENSIVVNLKFVNHPACGLLHKSYIISYPYKVVNNLFELFKKFRVANYIFEFVRIVTINFAFRQTLLSSF